MLFSFFLLFTVLENDSGHCATCHRHHNHHHRVNMQASGRMRQVKLSVSSASLSPHGSVGIPLPAALFKPFATQTSLYRPLATPLSRALVHNCEAWTIIFGSVSGLAGAWGAAGFL